MEIKISKCATRCHGCEHDFIHEQKVCSMATMENESLVRKDYCTDCRPGEREAALFCYWETQYNDPKMLDAEHQESLSPLRRLFYDLANSAERLDLAQAFLAAQLLKRQRAFRQMRESEDAEGTMRTTLFLDRAGNRLIETRDLNFSYAELDVARTQLMEQLRNLESPEAPSDPSAEPGPETNEQDNARASQAPALPEGETHP